MAITPLGNHYKGFIFAGENSRTYGVYITQPAVFSAPERDAELATIPGRNGDLLLDHGRWRNIEVTYNCGLPAKTEADFIKGVQDFRNVLASKVGYQRLEDEINTGEYRQGAFITGLDVDAIDTKAGTFTVHFSCHPQRYTTYGSYPQSVTSGGKVTNPYPYNARPQIIVTGYGDINIGADTLTVLNEQVGSLLLRTAGNKNAGYGTGAVYFSLDTGQVALLDNGDTITVQAGSVVDMGVVAKTYPDMVLDGITITPTGGVACHAVYTQVQSGANSERWSIVIDDTITFSKGTNGSATVTYDVVIPYKVSGTPYTYTGTFTFDVVYFDTSGEVGFVNFTETALPANMKSILVIDSSIFADVYGYSTRSTLTGLIYIDLDTGEAWLQNGLKKSSLNNLVSLPTALPTLPQGDTTITYDNTFTDFLIVPRWWRL